MRVLIRNTVLDGRSLLELVLAMKGTTLFSDHRDCEDYIDMVLRNAKMLAGIELAVKGDALDEKAASFLAVLVDQGLAVILDEKPAGVARWIETHTKKYAEGVFRGFIVEALGGKP